MTRRYLPEGVSGVKYIIPFENVMQAGSFDIYGQAGLIERAKKLIVEGADA